MRLFNSRAPLAVVAVLSLVAGAAGVVAAQQAAVVGRVTDQTTGQPLVNARITVPGTSLLAATNADGRYRLSNVPPGQVTVRATLLGYAAGHQTVTLGAGETAEADFPLQLAAFSLDEVVVTATGDQTKKEVGNSVARIDAVKQVEQGATQTFTDLLNAHAAGVQVLPGNQTGSPSRVRIRGTNSLSLSNEPVYVVDGVRINSANRSSSVCNVGCAPPSRVNDLNPDEIESLDVIKGPSATALYGTDAANGVVVIKTKRGKPGPARWSLYAEHGIIKDYNDYPIAYRGWRTTPTPSAATNTRQCFLVQVVSGFCTQDSITAYNLFDDPAASPNGTGRRAQYGLQVSGGSDAVRYYVSGDWEDETGVLQMPPFAVQRLVATRPLPNAGAIPDDQLRPNGLRKTSVRANLQANLNPRVDVSLSSGFISSRLRVPPTDNNTTGLLSNAFGGLGVKNNGRWGYRAFTPDQMFSELIGQDINRFIGSATANWRPTSWLAARGTAGIDFANRLDTDLCMQNQCTTFSTTTKTGFKQDNRTNFFQYTAEGNVSASVRLTSSLASRTTAGVQYFKNVFDRNGAYGENLSGGASTVTAGVIPLADEVTDISKTLGLYVEQYFAFKDRLFVTGALRADDNSAFGANFKAVYYPKLSVSYVISEEPAFPKWKWLNSLRLRGAIGASGVQPGTTDALRFFSPTKASVDATDNPALILQAIGNPNLRPERAREYEFGGDATLFDNRFNIELTYYNKRTKDALIARIVAPSEGASATQFENLGAVVNRGVEGLVDVRVLDGRLLGWDVSVNAAYNTNFIAEMGVDPATGKPIPPIVGTTTRQTAGYPINGWWQQPYTFADKDGNGIITADEITVADSRQFIGYPNPRWEVTYTSGIDLFNKRVRINALFDHKSGFYQLNGTERIRCENRNNCRGLIDRTAPLWEQARVVALRETPSRTQYGFIEKAGFVRLREASVTYEFPDAWARAFRASRVSLTVAGRNLWKTTSWSGIDPEANYFEGATGIVSNFQTVPPPTYWTARLNVSF